jgi:hypothetical protein
LLFHFVSFYVYRYVKRTYQRIKMWSQVRTPNRHDLIFDGQSPLLPV